MSVKTLYTAPVTEVVRVDCIQAFLAGSGLPPQGQDENGGAKRNFDTSWGLWDDPFDEKAAGSGDDMEQYHVKSLWED